jgi:sugar transferase (PEP-CTERM/EpsH1 system associated)/FemAB-related protein (PEP-CTERM system-associated)
MRILFLAHRIPYPPDKGDKIRSFHELRGLTDRGHEVHLLAFADDPDDLCHVQTLRERCASVDIVPLDRTRASLAAAARLGGTDPLSIGYFASGTMQRRVSALLSKVTPDAIVVCSSTMAQYVPDELVNRTVVDLVDVDSEKWREYSHASRAPFSWLFQTEARRLRRYEEGILARFPCALFSTHREAALLGDASAPRSLQVLGNGVDLEHFRPALGATLADTVPSNERSRLPDPSKPLLVFTGAMDYRPNVDGIGYFVREVLPIIRSSEPDVELAIVGRNPARAVRWLASVAGVTVTGAVADVRPYLRAARVAVVPLRIARGIQNKVLEALATGCPVVTTPEGVAGLAIEAGTHAIVASDPQDFAAAVVSVVRDDRIRRHLQLAGRDFVEARHQWGPVLDRFVGLVESVASGGASMTAAAVEGGTALASPASEATTVFRAASSPDADWDRYVERSATATFCHQAGWARVVERTWRHEAHHLFARRGGQLVGLLPLFLVRSRLFGTSLVSSPNAVYGGAVADDTAARTALIDEAKSLARRLQVDCLVLRDHLEDAAADRELKRRELYVTFDHPIATDPDELARSFPRDVRRMCRQGAGHGLKAVVGREELLDEFYDVYAASVRNLGTPVFPKRLFANFLAEFPVASDILLVRKASRVAGGVLSFYFRDTVMPYYGGAHRDFYRTGVNNFMYWELMRSAASRGYSRFDFGRSKLRTGAYAFKRGWGMKERPLPYSYYLVRATAIPEVNPSNPRLEPLIRAWKQMPLPVTKLVGPLLARGLP